MTKTPALLAAALTSVCLTLAAPAAGADTRPQSQQGQAQTPPPLPPPPATPDTPKPAPAPPPDAPKPAPAKSAPKAGDNTTHIFGVLPNYTSVGHGQQVEPLTTRATFVMTAQGAFDKVVFPFTALTAAVAQWEDQEKSWGQGWGAYGKRYATSFVDNTTATFMTTAVLPTLLRQDPRYFVRGEGGVWRRTGYALSRTFITQSRSGRTQFNYSDIFGNGLAAGMMNAYHPIEDRTLAATANRWAMQVLWDGLTNVLKEFWPDIHHRMRKSKSVTG